MARVVIAGCGYVGGALARELLPEGHDVYGLRRNPSGLPVGVHPIASDLAGGDPLGLPADVDFGVYCVGADGGDEEAYRRAYVDGLRAFLGALGAQSRPPRRVLFTSSTSVYAQTGGEWLDEDSATEPTRHAGRIMLEAEALVLTSELPSTVLRLGGIYGPGRTRLLERIARGEVAPEAGPPQFTNRIHRDDAAGMLRFLMFELSNGEPAPLYLGVDSEPAAQADVVAFLSAELGVPTPPARDAGASASPRRAGSKRCSNARILAAGYRLRYPTFRDGYRALAAELRGRGLEAPA